MNYLDISALKRFNFAAKKLLLKLHFEAKSGHVGSSLSCIDILSFIRFHCWQPRSTIVLSKGHAASALYSVLAVAGDINESDLLLNYYKDGTAFPVHPPPNRFPQIPFATGSLGHGPGICAGLALGTKLRSSDNGTPEPVFCVLSDGELNEGSVWESFAFAAHHKLNNLIFFIDNNELQGFGKTSEVLNMDPIVDKLQAFGIQVRQSDGHDFSSLYLAYTEAIANPHSSVAIVAKTVKGRGVPEIEGTVDSHYLPMTDSMYQGALKFYEKELRGD